MIELKTTIYKQEYILQIEETEEVYNIKVIIMKELFKMSFYKYYDSEKKKVNDIENVFRRVLYKINDIENDTVWYGSMNNILEYSLLLRSEYIKIKRDQKINSILNGL